MKYWTIWYVGITCEDNTPPGPDEKYPQSSCSDKNKLEVGTNKFKEGIMKFMERKTTSFEAIYNSSHSCVVQVEIYYFAKNLSLYLGLGCMFQETMM